MTERTSGPPSETETESGSHRILVALDVSMQGATVLEAAAMLAARRGAELVGLFIEDVNLIHLSELPFARELDRTSGAERALDSSRVARALHRQAEQMRLALNRAAELRHVRCSLRVVRGQYVSEALSAASGPDVVFVSGSEWFGLQAPARAPRGGTGQARARVTSRFRPVVAVFDGSAEAARALAMAAEIAQHGERELVVLLPPDAPAAQQELTAKAQALLGAYGPVTRFRTLAGLDVPALMHAVRQEGCSLLLLQRHQARSDTEAFQTLLNRIGCPVALVP